MNLKRFLVLMAVLQTLGGLAFAQDPQPPFPTDAKDSAGRLQLSAVLEDDFTKMVLGCLPGQLSNRRLTVTKGGLLGGKKETTAIPQALQSALPLKTTFVKGPSGQSLESLFTYIYSDEEKNADVDQATNPARFLDIPIDGSATGFASTEFNGAIYGETCTSAINGKISASGGYSLPIVDIKAALSTQASTSTTWSLDLVEGQFFSPLPHRFERFDFEGLYPRLLLWKWYYDQYSHGNSSVLTSQNWLLARFKGMSVFQVYGNKQQFSVAASANMSLAAPFVKADANIESNLTTGMNTKIRLFQTMAYLNLSSQKADRDWFPLPTAQQLASAPAFYTTLRETGPFIVQAKQTYVHHQVIQNFPQVLCTSGLWSPEASDGSPITDLAISVSPDKTVAKPNDRVAPCVFEMTYKVPDPVPGEKVQYYLAMKITDAFKFRLQAAPVTFVTADGPVLSEAVFPRNYEKRDIGGDFFELDWNIKLVVNETPTSKVNSVSLSPAAPTAMLQCGTKSRNLQLKNLSLQPGTSSTPKMLTFTVATGVSDQDRLKLNSQTTSEMEKCMLTGSLQFTFESGIPVVRQIASGSGIELYFPSTASPVVTVSPASLDITASVNGSATPQTLSIGNSGGGNLSWQLSVSHPQGTPSWLTVTPISGTAAGVVTVSINSSGLAAGTYNTQIVVSATGAANTVTVPVKLTIN